jgi:hypothetical protein
MCSKLVERMACKKGLVVMEKFAVIYVLKERSWCKWITKFVKWIRKVYVL